MRSRLLHWAARGILPLFLIFAIFLLLRGHDAPGGGFIAGLVTSVTAVLSALAFGVERVRAAIAPVVRRMPWIGLLIAVAAGLPAMALDEPFLTHHHVRVGATEHFTVQFSTTLLFDLGVYLVVVGAAITVLGVFAGEAPP